MKCSLYMVELSVRDWSASVRWYQEVLGLGVTLRVEADRFALLKAGTVRLALKEGEPHPDGVLLAFEVDDLSAWVSRLQGQSVEPTSPPKASPEGYRRARYTDPDGHAITLFEWGLGGSAP